LAKSVTATVELATTTERDDARVSGVFEAARQTFAADATLEALPNQTRVRHTRLTVQAPTSDQAIELATRMSAAMERAFGREGEGRLSVDVRRRTVPVADGTTTAVGSAMRIGAAVAGLLGALLIALGWFRFQAGPERLPPQFWWPAAGILVLSISPLFLPGAIIMALFFMAIPVLIAGLILHKTTELRHAATWPSTRARITRSKLSAKHHRHMAETTEVTNVPDIEYEFTLGDRVIRGTRIGIGETAGAGVEEALDHYRVGATVPVYYDPKNPENAVLERDPPLPIAWLYVIAAGIFVAGVAILAVFWNLTTILDGMAGYFPENAFLPGVAFFTLGALMVLAMLWASRRQVAEAAGWPETAGRVVSSSVEHYQKRVGDARSGTLVTFYEPVVEYAYRVNDRDYHSTQLSFGGKAAGSQATAEAKAARYPAGDQVLVHYDPKNPSNAVVDLKVALGTPFLVVAIVFVGLAIFFSGVFR
jgi:hypothetical protein